MFFYAYFFISIIGLLLGTFTDLRERIIPNKLTYSLIALGIALHALQSFLLNDFFILAFSVFSAAASFAFAYALWKAGVWAGGDVKLFTGIASLNPINYFVLGSFFGLSGQLFNAINLPFFFLSLFVFSLFSMLPYALLISVTGLASRKDLQKKNIEKVFSNSKKKFVSVLELSVIAFGVKALFDFIGFKNFEFNFLSLIVSFPFDWFLGIILLYFVLRLQKNVKYSFIALISVFVLISNPFNAVDIALSAVILFIALTLIMAFLYLLWINKEVMVSEKKISELEEGEIAGETIIESEGKLERVKGLNILKLIEYASKGQVQSVLSALNPQGKVIVSQRSAAGASLNQIKELKKYVNKNKLGNHILVKRSAPFAPAILIGYLALNLVGDLLWNLIF